MSTPGGVQYNGGFHEYTAGYPEYTGACLLHRWGGGGGWSFPENTGGCSVYGVIPCVHQGHIMCGGDIMSTTGDVQYTGVSIQIQ